VLSTACPGTFTFSANFNRPRSGRRALMSGRTYTDWPLMAGQFVPAQASVLAAASGPIHRKPSGAISSTSMRANVLVAAIAIVGPGCVAAIGTP